MYSFRVDTVNLFIVIFLVQEVVYLFKLFLNQIKPAKIIIHSSFNTHTFKWTSILFFCYPIQKATAIPVPVLMKGYMQKRACIVKSGT